MNNQRPIVRLEGILNEFDHPIESDGHSIWDGIYKEGFASDAQGNITIKVPGQPSFKRSVSSLIAEAQWMIEDLYGPQDNTQETSTEQRTHVNDVSFDDDDDAAPSIASDLIPDTSQNTEHERVGEPKPDLQRDKRVKVTPRQCGWIIKQYFDFNKSIREIAALTNTPRGKLSKSQIHRIVLKEKQRRAKEASETARRQHKKLPKPSLPVSEL